MPNARIDVRSAIPLVTSACPQSNIGLMNWLSLLPAMLTASLVFRCAAESTPLPADDAPLQYFIIVTGGELLEGVFPDAHTPFLTRSLRPFGCQCVGSIIVDDKREDIERAVRFATNRAPLVLVTGGLGPTPNDITRETLSAVTGIGLQESPEALAEMERRFNQSRDQLRANLRRQTLVPVRGGYLKNPHGTAVGLVFDSGTSLVVALPGPPRELQTMTAGELVPFLQRRFGIHELGASLTVRFVGAGQSTIDQVIKDHLTVPPGVIITSLFEGGRVDFTFSLPGHSTEDREVLKRLEAGIRQHLGSYLYASDGSSLEDVFLNNVFARGGTLSLLEIGSGGSIAGALSGASRGSALLAGAFVAPTGEAMARLLAIPLEDLPEAPLEQIQRLAAAAAVKTGSRWVAATSPLLTDATGAKSLWAVCRLPNGRWESQRLPVRGSDQAARAALNTQILDLLWKCSKFD